MPIKPVGPSRGQRRKSCGISVAQELQTLLPKMQVLTCFALLLAAVAITLSKKVDYWGTVEGKLHQNLAS